jgi:hypothetical protein
MHKEIEIELLESNDFFHNCLSDFKIHRGVPIGSPDQSLLCSGSL